MWKICLYLSILAILLVAIAAVCVKNIRQKKHKQTNMLMIIAAGVLLGAIFMFYPIHRVLPEGEGNGICRAALLSIFTGMQIFTIGTEYQVILDAIPFCPETLKGSYQLWASALFVVAPIFTFGFVLSLMKNLLSELRYFLGYFRDAYIFSELNDQSYALAKDIHDKRPKAVLVFTDVFEGTEEQTFELSEKAKNIGAICYKRDIMAVNFARHSKRKQLHFFTIGSDDAENLDQSLALIEKYRDRETAGLYVFSEGVEGEMLLCDADKGKMKVRRINPNRSMINQMLYEKGHMLFDSANELPDGTKDISVVVVGTGRLGQEVVRSLAWYCQMDGYSIHVDAFDRDPRARDKFTALAPELMSKKYNGILVDGEAQYTINIHGGVDVQTRSFARKIQALKGTTFVLVALGDDALNIATAVQLRTLFEQIHIEPVIQTVVYSTKQNRALANLKNFRGQSYKIDLIGDLESKYGEKVIIGTELEREALKIHLKYSDSEEEFWNYEYNYRSSMASAIHRSATVYCGILGAGKPEKDLTEAERESVEKLEHRRWNAYMRSEGFVFSGSKDKSSRNYLGKMHHDLVNFDELTEEEKRKDSRVAGG